MGFDRRDFIKTGTIAAGALLVNNNIHGKENNDVISEHSESLQKPPTEVIVLNKMAFGPTKAELEHIRNIGIDSYIDEQLNPDESKDKVVAKLLSKVKFPIKYTGTPVDNSVQVSEDRLLSSLDMSLEELWKSKAVMSKENFQEWIRPGMETFAATAIRAVYSKWQLREVMTDFWHNHFNISINSNVAIGSTLPSYDRDVIRKNVFGNFRTFIEEVGKSPCMMYYLNQEVSKASPANENYARELFELHTLGKENYVNEMYNNWRDVPGAFEGKAVGYIDEDVYEAARAFTGWTIASGKRTWRGEERLPDTGQFHYYDGWHDNYQKRILGIEIPSNQPPMSDGKKVYDIVAYHLGTAKHLCRKLCVRFISDNPPKALINKAVDKWMAAHTDDNQIQQVLEVILKSEEFKNTWGEKVKRPFEYTSSYIRAIGSPFIPNMHYFWNIAGMGQKMFMWPTPTGHPDEAGFWTSTGMMVKRWKFILGAIFWKDFGILKHEFGSDFPKDKSYKEVYHFYEDKLFGYTLSEATKSKILTAFSQGNKPDAIMSGNYSQNKYKVDNLLSLFGLLPEFNLR